MYKNYGVKHKIDVTFARPNSVTERVNLRNSFVDHMIAVVPDTEIQIYDVQIQFIV